jgi:hypothetical protein
MFLICDPASHLTSSLRRAERRRCARVGPGVGHLSVKPLWDRLKSSNPTRVADPCAGGGQGRVGDPEDEAVLADSVGLCLLAVLESWVAESGQTRANRQAASSAFLWIRKGA